MKLAPEQFERILRALQGPPVGHDKRASERFPLSTVVEFARPCADPACCGNGDGNGHAKERTNARPAWTWTRAISRDVCEQGMGLITTAPANRGERLIVRMPDGAGGPMLVACDVAHCQTVADGLVSIGLVFVERLNDAGNAPPAPPTTGATKRAAPARRSKSCCGTRAAATR
jgi:hypothetical protein